MNRRTFIQGTTAATGTALLDLAGGSPGRAAGKTSQKTRSPVPIGKVRIADAFWSPKFAVWRGTTINDCLDKFEKSGALENFDRVAAGKTDGFKGEPWWDGLVYEMITGSADFLVATPDASLERRVDGIIERISAAAAVDPKGYINTAVTLARVAPRWSAPPAAGDPHEDRFPHTLYNAGCLVEAGIHYQRATGKTQLLKVATRLANFMCKLMGPFPRQNIVPGHALPEMAFFELCRFYRENPNLRQTMNSLGGGEAYADLAQFWIDNRGNHTGRVSMGSYDQDDKPVKQQATMEGHAVRAALLATGIARGAVVVNRADYRAIGARWWQNMIEAKEYITGGLGAIPENEGFGPDYDLPNNGYCETCAAVAGGQFHQEMFVATGDAKYVDALERILFNGALSGVSLAGNTYFYTNHLSTGPQTRRWEWHSCPCCPPMFLKLMGALPGYIYAADSAGIYVNLYISNEAEITRNGNRVRLRQSTDYPWKENIKIHIDPERPERFRLRLRVPGWSGQAVATVNGKAIPAKPMADGYLLVDRIWKAGDTVTLTLPMPVRRKYADPRVVADRGRVALMRGPVVYCLEGIDCAVPVSSIVLPPDAAVQAKQDPAILGGVTVLTATAGVVHDTGDPNGTRAVASIPITAVPYYANNNRDATTMAVWIAEDAAVATPRTVESMATATSSHVNPADTLAALNDGISPRLPDDDTVPRFTWWDHRGSTEWVQYAFPADQHIRGVSVYWWDERRVQRHCRVPQEWHVEYREGDTWKRVTNVSKYGTEMDAFNETTFDPITTTALRLVVQLSSEWSAGILEWKVTSDRTPSKMVQIRS